MITKICGIQNKDTLLCLERNRVDFFGMIFYKKSPRNISFENANVLQKISKDLSSSKSSIKEELLPMLLAIYDEKMGNDINDIRLTKKLGLSGEDHLFLNGLSKSEDISESVMKLFDEEELTQENRENVESIVKESSANTTSQFTLDSFS